VTLSISISIAFVWNMAATYIQFGEDVSKNAWADMLVYLMVLGSTLPVILPLTKHLNMLPGQLSEFSIRSTKCFCCTNNHVNPDTSDILRCDRVLIYNTVAKWFSTRIGPSDRAQAMNCKLSEFDNYIRKDVSQIVLVTVCASRVPYRDCLLASLPYQLRSFDILAGVLHLDVRSFLLVYFCHNMTTSFLIMPTLFKICFSVVMLTYAQKPGCRNLFRVASYIFVCLIAVFFLAMNIVYKTYILNSASVETIVVYNIVVLLITMGIFFSSIFQHLLLPVRESIRATIKKSSPLLRGRSVG